MIHAKWALNVEAAAAAVLQLQGRHSAPRRAPAAHVILTSLYPAWNQWFFWRDSDRFVLMTRAPPVVCAHEPLCVFFWGIQEEITDKPSSHRQRSIFTQNAAGLWECLCLCVCVYVDGGWYLWWSCCVIEPSRMRTQYITADSLFPFFYMW